MTANGRARAHRAAAPCSHRTGLPPTGAGWSRSAAPESLGSARRSGRTAPRARPGWRPGLSPARPAWTPGLGTGVLRPARLSGRTRGSAAGDQVGPRRPEPPLLRLVPCAVGSLVWTAPPFEPKSSWVCSPSWTRAGLDATPEGACRRLALPLACSRSGARAPSRSSTSGTPALPRLGCVGPGLTPLASRCLWRSRPLGSRPEACRSAGSATTRRSRGASPLATLGVSPLRGSRPVSWVRRTAPGPGLDCSAVSHSALVWWPALSDLWSRRADAPDLAPVELPRASLLLRDRSRCGGTLWSVQSGLGVTEVVPLPGVLRSRPPKWLESKLPALRSGP